MTEQTETTTELPSIDRIEINGFAEDPVVSNDVREVAEGVTNLDGTGEDEITEITFVFDGGGRLRLELIDAHTVAQKIYRPDETSVWSSVQIDLEHGGEEDFVACAQNTYDAYVGMSSVDQFRAEWGELAEALKLQEDA